MSLRVQILVLAIVIVEKDFDLSIRYKVSHPENRDGMVNQEHILRRIVDRI